MMSDKLRFYRGDIVEILHLIPDQAEKLPNPKYFVGSKYRIDRVFPENEKYSSIKEEHYSLEGFPMNLWLNNTHFTASQLRIIKRKQNCFLRWLFGKLKT